MSRPQPPAWLAHAASLVLLAVLGAGLYAPALPAPFLLDDERNIVENPAIRMPDLSVGSLLRAGRESRAPRPVAYMSFALDHYAHGYAVEGFRAVNIGIHVLNGWLVYALALVLFRRLEELPSQRGRQPSGVPAGWLALVAALVFVAHPIQTQAVTYVVQRMSSLCAGFYLLALLLHATGRSRRGTPRALLFAAGVGAGLLALFTKQIAATLPLAVLGVEWFFFRDLDRAWLRRRAPRLVGLGVALVAALAAFVAATPAALDYGDRDFTLVERVLTQFRVVVLYLSLIAFPASGRLSLAHDVSTSRSLLDPPTTLASALLLAALALLAVRIAPTQRLVSFAILWFFLHLVIESSIIPLEMVFEHRLYLPLFGVSLLAAWGLAHLTAARRRLGLCATAALVACLAASTLARNFVWRDPIELWSRVVAENPSDTRSRNNLASALSRAGRLDEAERQYRETLRVTPEHARARTNLAMALERQGRVEEALAEAERAVRSAPDFAWSHYVLGNMHARHGRPELAAGELAAAARLEPSDALARFELGGALIQMGRFEEAVPPLRESLRLDPTFAPAHAALGGVYAQLRRFDDARSQLATALRLDPRIRGVREVLERLEVAERGAPDTSRSRLRRAAP